jgi:hypothetical protein
MHIKVQVEVIEQKDGSFIVRLNGSDIGELNNVDPLDELEAIYTLAEILHDSYHPNKPRNELVKEIRERLAKLLAWYLTE